MKKLFGILLFLPTMLFAQNPLLSEPSECRPFKHMDTGLTLGTTGVGIEISTPINQHLNVRAGFSIMPTIKNNCAYSMSAAGSLSGDVSPEEQERRIKHLCKDYLSDYVGCPVDEMVDMTRQIGYYNGKILVDWHPFHKKNWFFTAGAYIGSKLIGSVYNTQEESPTMLAINMYNKTYDEIQKLGPYEYPTISIGGHSMELDPEMGQQMIDRFNEYGRVGVRVGDNLDGTPNFLTPNEYGIMKAEAKVNVVKPFVGFGYTTCVGYDKRWNLGFNAGVMFWGKTSVIYYKNNNESIDLCRDVKNIGGIVGDYMKVVKALPVFPVVEFRLAYSIY